MKILRYSDKEKNKQVYGVFEGNTIYPVTGSPFSKPVVYDRINGISYDETLLLAPCTPSKVVALAINYQGATGQTEDMSEPLVFLKSNNTVIGVNDIVELPLQSKTWGEAELGVVIRKQVKNIDEKNVRLSQSSIYPCSRQEKEQRPPHLLPIRSS